MIDTVVLATDAVTGCRLFVRDISVVGIDRVIFNDPATIVFWDDGEKTVVKAHSEKYDPEKGLAMCIAKRYFGNEGNYFNHLKPWLEQEKKRRADEFEKWLRKEFGGAE